MSSAGAGTGASRRMRERPPGCPGKRSASYLILTLRLAQRALEASFAWPVSIGEV